MIGFAPVEMTVEKINQLMDSEFEILDGRAWLGKKRTIKGKNGSQNSSVTMDMEVFVSLTQEDSSAVNKAKIFLTEKEFPPFCAALRKHHLSFPTNYSQRLVQSAETYIIHLESQESPVNFIERLASALEYIKFHTV